MDERADGAGFVEEQVRHWQRSQRLADRFRLELEPLLPAGLRREQSRQEDYCHVAASTERIGGRCRAASVTCPSRNA